MSRESLTRIKNIFKEWGALVLSIAGGALYLVQAVNFAHSLDSILDEGAYLFKGYLFITGQYVPYQPYGPWTNKMPLSFLLQGVVQYLFGPGLGAGRYFSIFLAMLMLLGLWLLARRFGGKWWAAGIVLFFAINPDLIYVYSLAVSQVLVACMLVWMLVLVVGADRKTWQIAAGSVLAGLIVLTRINMGFILPLVVLYIFWEHGKRMAAISIISCITPLIIVNWIYWPDILTRYAFIVPRSLTPFLDPWRTSVSYQPLWNPTIYPINRLLSLLQTTRIHFTAVLGAIIAWILWPRREDWENKSEYRSAVFLSLLFISLLAFHLWVALGNDFCIYCLAGYTSFFSLTGLLLVIITLPKWRQHIPIWKLVVLIISVLLFAIVSGFGAFPEIGNQLLELRIPETLLDFPELELITLKKFLKVEHKIEGREARQLVPTIVGIVIGLIILISSHELWNRYKIRAARINKSQPAPGYGYWLMIIFLITGTLLAPMFYFYNTQNERTCDQSVIAAYDATGEHLARIIPPGSQVYWNAGNSMIPLMHVADVKIYPPQLNGAYSFKIEGESDTELLLRLGYWNSILKEQWLGEADYILVMDIPDKEEFLANLVASNEFIELESTPPIDPCDDTTRIRIFLRMD
jgi:hypothetical protein